MIELQGRFVRNGIDLFKVCQRAYNYSAVELAKRASKVYWNNETIFGEPYVDVLRRGESLDGCHLYPAGATRYKHLACLPANIFPMPRTAHRFWDYRQVHEKIEMLVSECSLEYRAEIVEIVEALGELI